MQQCQPWSVSRPGLKRVTPELLERDDNNVQLFCGVRIARDGAPYCAERMGRVYLKAKPISKPTVHWLTTQHQHSWSWDTAA
jgi:hypothetical protein